MASLLAVATTIGVGACSAQLSGNTYHGDGFAFRIASPPNDWKRIHVSHASLAFRDEEQLLYAHTADAGFYERVLLPRKLALARLYRRRYSWWLDARLMLATICTAPGLDSVATLFMGPVLVRRARAGLNGAPPRSPASGTDRGNGSGGTGSRQAGDVGWTEVVAAADGR